jgi:hypothetical protein
MKSSIKATATRQHFVVWKTKVATIHWHAVTNPLQVNAIPLVALNAPDLPDKMCVSHGVFG